MDAGRDRCQASRMITTIRRATVDDAPQLSHLAAATFRDTFGPDNDPVDMDTYVAAAFSPAQQATEIANPASIVLLAERPDGADGAGAAELVGYALMTRGPVPAAVTGALPLEVKRLYVARAWHGHGVAQTLMDATLAAARASGARTVWLGVWERNARAAAFYAKYGFTRVGEHTFVLGADHQTDWLFARPLDP